MIYVVIRSDEPYFYICLLCVIFDVSVIMFNKRQLTYEKDQVSGDLGSDFFHCNLQAFCFGLIVNSTRQSYPI